jgi:hypothetical protein
MSKDTIVNHLLARKQDRQVISRNMNETLTSKYMNVTSTSKATNKAQETKRFFSEVQHHESDYVSIEEFTKGQIAHPKTSPNDHIRSSLALHYDYSSHEEDNKNFSCLNRKLGSP